MKKLFFIGVILFSLQGYSQKTELSEQAEISVITCGPGQEQVFTAFGHSAIRVYDPVHQINVAFNYGVFDFNQPNFYLNFARGKNYYRLAVQDYDRFVYAYIYYNRYVHEQMLNLTGKQKQRLFDYLQWNALPENQYYLYDYFYDNCATKLPELMTKVFGDTVLFDGSYITSNYSIRELTDLYLTEQPWGDLGIDICLGLPMDKIASPYEYMFLPDFVESGFDHAVINGKPLVKRKLIINEPLSQQTSGSTMITPLSIFSFFGLITLAITLFDFYRKKKSNWYDIVLFTSIGILGVLLMLLWVATDHKAAANNLNLLWALPTHLIISFALIKKYVGIRKYFLVILIINAFLLFSWPWLPQLLHHSLIPIILAISMRVLVQYRTP